MADKTKKEIVIGIAGALTDALRASIQDVLKDHKDVVIVEGAEIEKEKSELQKLIESLSIDKNDLLKDIDLLNAKVKSSDEYIAELTVQINDLSSELESASDAVEKGYQTVKSGKKTYRVLGKKFNYQSTEYTIEDLIKNQKLIDELVGLGVGFLIEVKEGK